MKITAKQYAQSLYEVVQGKTSGQVKDVIENFVKILAANNNLGLGDRIIDEFQKISNQKSGIVEASVASVKDLNGDTIKAIKAYLGDITKAKNINLSEVIDKDILGGVIIKYDDKILDGSLKTRLSELNKMMKK